MSVGQLHSLLRIREANVKNNQGELSGLLGALLRGPPPPGQQLASCSLPSRGPHAVSLTPGEAYQVRLVGPGPCPGPGPGLRGLWDSTCTTWSTVLHGPAIVPYDCSSVAVCACTTWPDLLPVGLSPARPGPARPSPRGQRGPSWLERD